MLPGIGASAEQEIHRCALEDGTVAFQGTPCDPPPPAADTAETGPVDSDSTPPGDSLSDFVNPFDEPKESPEAAEPALPQPASQDRQVCETMARDAIDAIDLKMREGYSTEEGKQFLAQLLGLTQQLRACKQL
jgi:hypothetical protein